MRILNNFALLVVLVSMEGCVSARGQFASSQMNLVYQPRTEPQKIEMYRSQMPNKKMIEIGAANACCSGDPNHLIEILQKTASEHGGDGLIGIDVNATGGATATVIRFAE